MKEITKRLLSATVAIGISFGAITALESQQVEASDINNSIYTANKDLANWTVEVQLAQKEFDQANSYYDKAMDYADEAETKTADAYENYKKALELYKQNPTAANKENAQNAYTAYYKAKQLDDSAYNMMMSYGKQYESAKSKLENAKKNLAKAQKLLALLKDYQKGLTPQVKIIHEIETVPVPQPTTNTSTAEVSSNSTKSENIPQNDASHQPISKVKVSLKKKINTLQNHKSLPLKGKGYVALLKIKHSVSVVKINKTNKIIKLHAKAKRAKLYNIKEIKRINKQKWSKISSKNEWVNLKNFNLFKKID